MTAQLVATFVLETEIEKSLLQIRSEFKLVYDKIFVLTTEESEVILTYNLSTNIRKPFLPGTILIHRKKDTNTLYTINALNELIKSLNNGILDKTFPIKWDHYKNTILLYEKSALKILKTSLKFID